MPFPSRFLARRRREPLAVAFGRRGLVARTVGGRWIRIPFPATLLNPSPTEPNLAAPAEAARFLLEARDVLGAGSQRFDRAVVAVPDRAVHASLATGAAAGDLRRLRSGLVMALTSGSGTSDPGLDRRFRFGAMPTGPRRGRTVLGAVSAAAVVSQYETSVEAAGLSPRWVDAISLAILPEWLAAPPDSGPRALLLLHRRHFVLVGAAGTRMTGFRMRLRARLDPEPPVLAVRRLAADARLAVMVWGAGAGGVSEGLRSRGLELAQVKPAAAESGGEAALSPVVDAALAALLRRLGARPAPLVAAPAAPSALAA